MRVFFILSLLLLINNTALANSQDTDDALVFDDFPLKEDLHLPEWFSLSFLDLQESLDDALKEGKKGIILYFGRKDCAYCESLLEINWGDPAIIKFTQQHYNVIAIDVRGDRTVTDFNGKTWTEKNFAAHRRTNFTPSLLFYNAKAQLALKLPGYRPKYQFRAALEYVADSHYLRESFRQYLTRAEAALSFGSEELNENDTFQTPPYNLDRRKNTKQSSQVNPLVVLFEHGRCHACDVLHGDTLSKPEVTSQLEELDVVQLNSMDDTPVITPQGKHTTARKWADDLNLTFAPSLIFFDETGNEILRVESVIRFYRLNNVLRYVIGKEYNNYPTFQAWLHEIRKNIKSSKQ
ncbi:MAG: thioredoxin [endosymbiont of Galathealinum brachiosum]|uniref:Thioredoxin n=1 Tax=endosymbiont of Galathealinum brachiosum TaxID=2200906 RepID=A0A370DG39_9GAMM|nr:MAG: thioredoxin [endosymbiont of Galathealinum brachiosum]